MIEMRLECLLHHAMYVIELTEESEDLSPLFHWLKDEETIFLLGLFHFPRDTQESGSRIAPCRQGPPLYGWKKEDIAAEGNEAEILPPSHTEALP